jgi:serine protease SohB
LRSTLRERFGEEVSTPLVAADRGFLGRRLRGIVGAPPFGDAAGLAEEFLSAIEARALWARYGL